MTNIEQLKKETNEITDSLKKLKENVSISETDKKTQAEALKTKAEQAKQKIKDEIHSLESKTDDESKKKKEEAETLLNSFEETMNLYASILNNGNKGAETITETKPAAATETKPEEKQDENKNFFTKSKEWVGEQWNDVWDKEKWKTEGGKNLLRTAGFVATGVGGVALAYKGIKSLWNRAFGDKKKEDGKSESDSKESSSKKKDDGESFWDGSVGKFIKGAGAVLGVGTGVYYVAHGLYTKNRGLNDLWDREKGKKLEFDEAMSYAAGAVSNQDNKEGMGYGLNLKFDENTSEIEAYGQRIKIDKNKRMIVGLKNVEFKKNEHMICAAILIAYLKKTYSGKCASDNPFYCTGDWQGDINVSTGNGKEEGVDGTGNAGRKVGTTITGIATIAAGLFGSPVAGVAVGATTMPMGYALGSMYDHDNIMNNLMPELDNTVGKKRLVYYLNDMDCRKERYQTAEDVTDSPIKKEVTDFVEEIKKDSYLNPVGSQNFIDAKPDPNDKTKYTIEAFGMNVDVKVTETDFADTMPLMKGMPFTKSKKIKILGISGGDQNIKANLNIGNLSNSEVSLKEGLYMIALINKTIEKFHHKGVKTPYIQYTTKWIKKNPIYDVRKRANDEEATHSRGIYFNDTKRTPNPLNSDFYHIDSLIYPKDLCKKHMPITFEDDDKWDNFIKFLNEGITDEANVPIWKKP